jgi:2-isopropylmalate synthase
VLCLCDTNGGTITSRLAEIVADVRQQFDGVLGIHPHNDTDVAVANALAAIEGGATHVQGCMNGYGERCGNANLSSIIANLEIKLGHTTIARRQSRTADPGLPLYLRAGESSVAQRSTVCRAERVRA